MFKPFLWFVKATGWPIQALALRKNIYYEDNDKSLRKIKGGATIVSNHTSIYDFPLIMYTFMSRDIHVVTADVLYKLKSLKLFLPQIGAIKVRRDDHDFAFLKKAEKLLNKRKVCLFFPESFINGVEKNQGLLEFKSSYILPSLQTNTPIIPVATNGIYGKNRKKYKQKTKIMIGKPININALWSENKSIKENIIYINNYIKNKIQQMLDQLRCAK